MIKLFKNVDEKLADIGFKKIEENKHLCEYDRENNEFGYIQKVVISYKQRHTKEFVDAGDTFTISFFGGEHMKELGYLGKVSGKDVPDKIEQSGLHLTEVDGQPGFEEATQVLVCRKLYQDDIKPENFYEPEEDERWYPEKDYHTMYIAEIRECWVRE